jgi:peptide/nickel transport system substrate-binding protein
MKRILIALIALALVALGAPAQATSLRWASQDDAATMDPHAFNHGMTMTVLQHVYEGLVRRDREMRIEPALALSWSQSQPTIWRFELRPNVRFHQGEAFTADDVVFSFERAMSQRSDMRVFAASITEVRAVGPLTVEIVTQFPNGALIQSLPEIRVMSRSWAQRHGAELPADFRQRQENHATRHANGTGPFRLTTREPDVRTVLTANAEWWDRPQHNLTSATLVRIASDATRVAALLSGEVDFAFPIPLQDLERIEGNANLRVLQAPEIRTMFLAMDLHRDELQYGSVRGRNPFRDRRVRQALYQAIDVVTINARVMRNSSPPTGNMLAPGINSVDPALQARAHPFDLATAGQLMREAGYGEGFEVTLDCPNDRYVNDERVCQAIAGMLAQINIRVNLNLMPSARFFAKIGARDTSLAFFGYTPVNMDAYNTLSVVMHSPGDGHGQWNVGNYSNPEFDRAVAAVLSEMDPERRTAFVTRALQIHRADIGHIPLYQQGIAWGMRRNVDIPIQTDNRVNVSYARIR